MNTRIRGVLLHGGPGTGKSEVTRCLLACLDAFCAAIGEPKCYATCAMYGNAAKNINGGTVASTFATTKAHGTRKMKPENAAKYASDFTSVMVSGGASASKSSKADRWSSGTSRSTCRSKEPFRSPSGRFSVQRTGAPHAYRYLQPSPKSSRKTGTFS